MSFQPLAENESCKFANFFWILNVNCGGPTSNCGIGSIAVISIQSGFAPVKVTFWKLPRERAELVQKSDQIA